MTITGLMAGIPLHLPVCRRHPRLRALSSRLHPTVTGKPRSVQEGEAGTRRGSEVVGRVLESGRGTIRCDSVEYWQQRIWGTWYAIGFHGMVGIPLGQGGIRMHGGHAALPLLMVCFSSMAGLSGAGRHQGTCSPGGMEVQCRRSAAFDCMPQPAACCPDWMAGLPDALPLSRLSIPGTHDSLSLFGSRRLRCQSWGLEAQLAAGVRFLDVRCKLARGELHIYHLCTFQQASLRGVLRRTLRFLRAHPGEAVLMRIKEELPIFPRPGFAARLHRCLLEEGQGRVWCREEVPTLGQGLAPKVRTLREMQLQQAPPTLHMEIWMATAAAFQMGLPCPWGHTPTGYRTGQSSAVCNSVGSVDGAACRSTKAKWLRHKKDLKTHIVPVSALPAENKSAI
ncbi:uncharacterized protein M6G45_006162 isoform 2-T2 [Spheniscus humboldti]